MVDDSELIAKKVIEKLIGNENICEMSGCYNDVWCSLYTAPYYENGSSHKQELLCK